MITLVSAPTNLGLRPPRPGKVPGTYRAPDALRSAGLFQRLSAAGATDGGVVQAGAYIDDDDTRAPGHVRNESAMIDHARRLAEHLTQALTSGHTPLVIGGDCSLLIGTGLALSRRGGSGLVHIDGHTDFRHPGNSDQCASVAGEDLAAAIGLHWPAIADIDEAGPYFDPASAVHIGCREDDADMAEVRSRIGLVLPAREAVGRGMREAAEAARAVAGGSGYWIQLDVDVLDPTMMPAVDSPTPGGLSPDQLVALLQALAPSAIGASVTVFDPDLDPDGSSAHLLTEVLSTGFEHLGSCAG